MPVEINLPDPERPEYRGIPSLAFEELEDFLKKYRSKDGRGGSFLVTGSWGMGKTWLLERLKKRVGGQKDDCLLIVSINALRVVGENADLSREQYDKDGKLVRMLPTSFVFMRLYVLGLYAEMRHQMRKAALEGVQGKLCPRSREQLAQAFTDLDNCPSREVLRQIYEDIADARRTARNGEMERRAGTSSADGVQLQPLLTGNLETELHAVQSVCDLAKSCLGTYRRRYSNKDNETSETTSGSKADNQENGSDMSLGTLLSAMGIGGGLLSVLMSNGNGLVATAGLGISALGGAGLWWVKQMKNQKRENSQEETWERDYTIENSEGEILHLQHVLEVANIFPVVVVDEVDKVFSEDLRSIQDRLYGPDQKPEDNVGRTPPIEAGKETPQVELSEGPMQPIRSGGA